MAWTWVDSVGVVHNTPVGYIDAAGIHIPLLQDCIDYYVSGYQGIYGSDTYLGSDSQDGELVGLLSQAINDTNAACVSTYNSFSPQTAQGVGLSSLVKINGLTRAQSSYSTVQVMLVGNAYTPISGGIVTDPAGNPWTIADYTTIPQAGYVTVTAVCKNPGAIDLASGVALTIATQIYGWQTATTASAATVGAPVEDDPALRLRQATSASIPSLTGMAGLIGSLLALPGVAAVVPYENDTATTDTNGVPAGAVAMMISGGVNTQIAATILRKKTMGCGTYGTTSTLVYDTAGIPHTIKWFIPTNVPISWAISIRTVGTAFTFDMETQIAAAVAAWTSGLAEGQDVSITRSYSVINAVGDSFEIVSVEAARIPGTPSTSDVVIAFNEQAICLAANVTITVVP